MKILKYNIIVLLLAIGLSACTDHFESANTNPNKETVGTVESAAMFEPILYGAGNVWAYYCWSWNDELIQYTAFTGGTTRQEHRYFISDANWQAVWNTYSRYANNDVHMYDLAVKEENESMQAVA